MIERAYHVTVTWPKHRDRQPWLLLVHANSPADAATALSGLVDDGGAIASIEPQRIVSADWYRVRIRRPFGVVLVVTLNAKTELEAVAKCKKIKGWLGRVIDVEPIDEPDIKFDP